MEFSEELNKEIYYRRFGQDYEFRKEMYIILCERFFQKYIPKESKILEIGAGYCEFINAINAKTKIALDSNPDTAKHANKDVDIVIGLSTNMDLIDTASIDIVFCNNFFEHLSRPEIIKTLKEVYRVLKPGGEILILLPNIRFCYNDYWMFFDHITPLEDRSMTEVLFITGFLLNECIPKFLPYTTKSRMPKSLAGIKLYLKLPILWKFFGKQAFIRAEKPKYVPNQMNN